MKKMFLIIALTGLTGCGRVNSSSPWVLDLDSKRQLQIWTEESTDSIGAELPGKPPNMSRVPRALKSADGKVLFRYEMGVIQGDGAAYRLILRPASIGPTFGGQREVTLMPNDIVRVDLLEQPGTGRKIVDVFMLADKQPDVSFGAHVAKLHSMLFHFVHGN